MQAKAKRYIGHNPAGLLLLLSLLMTVATGLAMYGTDKGTGILASISNRHEELWEEIHELLANFTVVLVIVHIIGVAVESVIHRENLARAMLHGNKKRP